MLPLHNIIDTMQKQYLLMCSAAVCCSMQAQKSAEQKSQRPNILICVADDAGHMGAYGTPWVNTPAFDHVAAEGLLMNNAYTCNAKSAPSRATMITGRNSWQLEEAANHWCYFPTNYKSIFEALGEIGYFTGYTGKGWAPGIALDNDGNRRELTGKKWGARHLKPETNSISDIDYASNFMDFINNWDRNRPFIFWYGAREPHRAYEYESSIRFGKKLSDINEVPPYWPDTEVVRRDMLDYAVEIEHFDRHLQQMLQQLTDIGELDNTIVIVMSDHNMPFPRCKGQEYHESNHIPMAVMWKAGLKAPGRRIDHYISTIDIVPTLLDAIGTTAEQLGMAPVTGRSFMDLIQNTDNGIDRNYMMMGRERHDVGRPNDEGYPIRAMIRGNFLFIRNYKPDRWPAGNPETGYMDVDKSPTKTAVLQTRRDSSTAYMWQLSFGKRGETELYDIKNDPHCMNNLATVPAYQQLLSDMDKEMSSRLREQGDPRALGNGDIFDKYPDASKAKQLYNRIIAGETIDTNWIDNSDIEPKASGLDISDSELFKALHNK
ncbi:MAG: sulfatase [Muribaculaceae bacterium]